jgi:23S rRNA (guanosine2251-2'-O)-methyltransferase
MLSVIYGLHPVLETLRAGRRGIEKIYLARGNALDPLVMAQVSDAKIPVLQVSTQQILSIAGSQNHQGLAAEVEPFSYWDLEEIVAGASGDRGLILVLDGIQDPSNLGSILRSAECLGATAVVLTKDRSVSVTPAVEKAAAGASAHMRIARVVNLVRAMDVLKTSGYWTYGTDSRSSATVYSLDLRTSVAFVLGSEGKGMRRLVRENCDGIVSVPMTGKIDSLNVSQTATILLAEAFRQRMSS